MHKHHELIINHIKKYQGFFYKLRDKITTKNKYMLYNAWIASKLHYAAEVYLNTDSNQIKKLQTWQNRILKIMFMKPKFHNTTALYKELQLLNLRQIEQYKLY